MHPVRSRLRTSVEHGHGKFFRNRLLTLTAEEVGSYIDQLDQEADKIRAESIKMSWHMRGGISYDQVMQMSYGERTMIAALVKENMETTNKTKLPYF